MTLLIASVLLAAAAAAWVIIPIWVGRAAPVWDALPGAIIEAEAHKSAAFSSLEEIEYDRLAGKLDQKDYERLRVQLSREALHAVRSAEAVAGSPASADRPANNGEVHECGFANPPGSRFCAGCGARLS